MSVFVDTAVIMYAGGGEHRMRDPSRRLLEATVDGAIDAVTSAEVIQEIYHRFTALDDRSRGAAMAEAALDVFGLVLPVTDSVMRRMTDLVLRFPNLSARDLVHVATCADARIDIIVSPDRAFDEVAGLERIDPLEVDILL